MMARARQNNSLSLHIWSSRDNTQHHMVVGSPSCTSGARHVHARWARCGLDTTTGSAGKSRAASATRAARVEEASRAASARDGNARAAIRGSHRRNVSRKASARSTSDGGDAGRDSA